MLYRSYKFQRDLEFDTLIMLDIFKSFHLPVSKITVELNESGKVCNLTFYSKYTGAHFYNFSDLITSQMVDVQKLIDFATNNLGLDVSKSTVDDTVELIYTELSTLLSLNNLVFEI